MKTSRLVIANWVTGDWQALYIDGKLAREDHNLTAEDVLEALGVTCTFRALPNGYYDHAPLDEEGLPS